MSPGPINQLVPPTPGPRLDRAKTLSDFEVDDFLDMLLKGKIRRRFSGSGAVDLA